MIDILNNNWIVGSGTGVISWIVVTFITKRLLSQRGEKEVARAIETGNREIIYALRPCVSDELVPPLDVVVALINSAARRHKLERRQLLNPKAISEELIKEVMDSSFITSEAKLRYCESLKTLAPQQETELDRTIQKENENFVARVEFRERIIFVFSIMAGMIAAMFTVVASFLRSAQSPLISNVLGSFLPTVLILGVIVFVTNVLLLALKVRHKRLRAEFGLKSRAGEES